MKALANTYNAIGEAQHRGQKLDAAQKAYQQALDIRERLAQQAPNDVENRRQLANSYMNIGLEEKDSGHLAEAGRKFQQAQKIRSDLLKEQPDSVRVQRDVAMADYNQGLLDVKAENFAAAGKSFGDAIRLFAALVKLQPQDMTLQYRLAICYRLLGDLRAKEGAVEESNTAYAESIATLTRLVERNPDVAEYASVLAGFYMNFGSRQPATASLASFEHARELLQALVEKYPDNPQFRCDRAATHRSLGNLESAAGHAEKAKEYLKSSLDELTAALVKQFSTQRGIRFAARRKRKRPSKRNPNPIDPPIVAARRNFVGGDYPRAPIVQKLQAGKYAQWQFFVQIPQFRLDPESRMSRLFQFRSVRAVAALGIALLSAPGPTFGQTSPAESPTTVIPQGADSNPYLNLEILPPVSGVPAANLPNSSAVAQTSIPAMPGISAAGCAAPQFSLATTPNMIGDLPDGRYTIVEDRAPGVSVGGVVSSAAADDRRAKISEDSSPIPTDRVFCDFNQFESAALTIDGHIINVDRTTFGLEKTFFNGACSIEVRVPIVTGLRADESDPVAVDGNEGTAIGNISITPKYLFLKSDTWASSVGCTVDLPTAPDISDSLAPYAITSVRNDSVHLEPFVGLLLAPNSRLFSISYIQVDVDANGSPVTAQFFGGPVEFVGRFRDPTLMHVDISVGYWLYDRRAESLSSFGHSAWISGIAPIVELHYTTCLEAVSQHVAALNGEFAGQDILDMTGGLSFQFGPLSSLTVAACAPLRTEARDRAFDAEAIVQFNQHF